MRNREKKEQVYEEFSAFMLLRPDRLQDVNALDVSKIFSDMNIYGSKHIQTASKQLFALRSKVNEATDPEVVESLTNALERVRAELLDAIREDLGVDD